MTPTRPLLRYHGGKWRLAPWIISHFPAHGLYVEPFGGGASVLLRKKPALQEVYNDLDGEIVNLFRVLRDVHQAESLMRLLSLTPHSRAEYDQSCLPATDLCPVETARRTLVRAFMGYGNGTTGQYKTGFRNRHKSGESGLAKNWAKYPASVNSFVDRLRGVTLECTDAMYCIPRYDTRETLFYVDPPYLMETRTAHGAGYRHELTTEQHIQLSGILREVRGMVILSGYDSPLYRELYADWRMVTRCTTAEKASKRIEYLWISPKASAVMPQRSLMECLPLRTTRRGTE